MASASEWLALAWLFQESILDAVLANGMAAGVLHVGKGGEPSMIHLPADQMSTLIQTSFSFELPAGEQAVELILQDVVCKESGHGDESISLIFEGPLELSLPQRTYHVRHSKLETFLIFIVPIGRSMQGSTYQSVINRMASKETVLTE